MVLRAVFCDNDLTSGGPSPILQTHLPVGGRSGGRFVRGDRRPERRRYDEFDQA